MDSELNSKEERKNRDGMSDAEVMKTSLSGYASKVLKRSLVTGVANIIETKSWAKKIFKATVLMVCIGGFFYQATLFVLYILTYPSVVNIEVYVPAYFVRPAYTFCSNNGIKRSKFCEKYPERCYTPDSREKFCKMYKYYCSALEDTENITVVRPEYYYSEKNISFEELVELGHDYESMMLLNFNENPSELNGPIMLRRPDDVLVLCYSHHLRIDSELEPMLKAKPDRLSKTIDTFWLNLEPTEVFRPERDPGLIFHLHTPFSLENPLENGMFIRSRRNYVIHFRLEEDLLLPHPFPSDCVNYTELWIKRGRTGPRSQESCIEKCELDYCLKDCNCTFPEVFYPTNQTVCSMSYQYCSGDEIRAPWDEELTECNKLCKDDCQKFKYTYHQQFRLRETQPNHTEGSIDEAYVSEISIIASENEVLKFQYRPQYQYLDILSSLGGFIGAWLGISLVAIIDLLESFASIGTFFFRRRRIANQ